MIETIIAVIGLVLAWLTYQKTFHAKPKQEKDLLLVQFRANQTVSREVRELLIAYAQKHNAFKEHIFPGVTYESYINQMERSYEENLSDALYEKIKHENIPKEMLLSMLRSAEEQFNSLLQIKTQYNLLINQA